MRHLFIIHIAFLSVIACVFCSLFFFVPDKYTLFLMGTSMGNQILKYVFYAIAGIVIVGSVWFALFRNMEGLGLLWLSGFSFCFMLVFNLGMGYETANMPHQDIVGGLLSLLFFNAIVGFLSLSVMAFLLTLTGLGQNILVYPILIIDGLTLSLMGYIGMWGWIPVVFAIALYVWVYRGINEAVFEEIPVRDPIPRCGGGSSDVVDLNQERDPEHWDGSGYTSSRGH